MRNIVVTPTELEKEHLLTAGLKDIEVVGFGPIGSAIGATRILLKERPERLVLVGLAGTFDRERLAPGEASRFGNVRLAGIGVENVDGVQALDFPQVPGRPEPGDGWPLSGPGPELLTVCRLLTDPAALARRRRCHPGAVAEDMEGWAVAAACHAADVPLVIVRGISNEVGDRHHPDWPVPAATRAAADLVRDILQP